MTGRIPLFFSSYSTRIAIFIFVNVLFSCGTVKIYDHPKEPVLLSNETESAAANHNDSLVVLSFNIAKAEKIEQAILELQAFESNTPVDIFLLQEMSEEGVRSIAKELKLNYLYLPVVFNELLKKNIGNAILSKGIISNPEKLILPHKKWVNGRRRHVAVGEVNIRNKKLLVYSVHTETSTMGRKKRQDQRDAILEHARKQSDLYQYLVIGGDFNTLFPKDADRAVQEFKASGFQWATEGAGHTARAFFGMIKPREDYIFTSGLQVVRGGKIDSSEASDHLPVYAVFRLTPGPSPGEKGK